MSRNIGALGTILGVWAHPDDEAFLSGGLMAAARASRQRVVVVTATRGELGSPDPVAWPPERLAERRQVELDASLEALGVFEHVILGHPDGGCADVDFEIGAAQVAGAIDAVAPDTILTFGPDGYTGHSDHRTMSAWVGSAVKWTGTRARILHATATRAFLDEFEDVHRDFDVFFAGVPSITDEADTTVDLRLSGRLLDRKVAALRAQSSQTAGLIEGLGASRFRRWVSRESFAAV
ncbi:MAG TPA: PIG-L family deacetylase [Acidimicrobiia bacterium]|nr:PIG-L family deacetylase [Acidimicrobiia bacterium]